VETSGPADILRPTLLAGRTEEVARRARFWRGKEAAGAKASTATRAQRAEWERTKQVYIIGG
jgi:hypothetical protein